MTRAAAIAAVLAAVALADGEGVELVYEFGEGEAAAAAKVLTRRMELLGIDGAKATALADGRRVVLRLGASDRLEEVRRAAARVGHLELRRVVNPDTPGYEKRCKTLAEALARGTEAALACEIPADSLTPRERERWRGGLRWYRNPSPSEALKEDWVLCELDGWAITEQALEDVRVSPMEGPDQPGVLFRVKEGFRANMAELTRREEEEVRLAIIVDGDVLSAPVLQVPLRENGAITMKDERDARALGAAIGGGTLPSRPRLVEQRSAGK